MTTPKQELKIERIFDAPRELVWNAWTQPELVMQWWGPEPFSSPVCKIDFRVGGKFVFCMRSPDGQDYWTGGSYDQINPIESMECSVWFSTDNGDVVDPSSYGFPAAFPRVQKQNVTFEDLGEQTRLTITYEVESDEVMKIYGQVQMKEGWESSLNKFARVLARNN